jgi:hypothetical protein
VLAVMMPLFGRLFDLHLYSNAFVIAAAIPLFGFAGWLWFSGASAGGQRASGPGPAPRL